MVTEMTTERKTLTPDQIKRCYDTAQAAARELDPKCERVTPLSPCSYEVVGRKGDRYTVTIDRAGYHCTCLGDQHPACWHRADAMRFRFVQKWQAASATATPAVAPATEPVKTQPVRLTLSQLFDLDDAKRAAAGLL